MSSTRFPKQAYVRRLEAVYDELQSWHDQYRLSGLWSTDELREVRLDERCAVLEETQRRILQAVNMLHGMPRVS